MKKKIMHKQFIKYYIWFPQATFISYDANRVCKPYHVTREKLQFPGKKEWSRNGVLGWSREYFMNISLILKWSAEEWWRKTEPSVNHQPLAKELTNSNSRICLIGIKILAWEAQWFVSSSFQPSNTENLQGTSWSAMIKNCTKLYQ